MSKLPVVTARDVIRIVERVGFEFDRQKGSPTVYIRTSDRRRVVVPVHKGRDVKPGTLHGLVDDIGLSVEEFVAML